MITVIEPKNGGATPRNVWMKRPVHGPKDSRTRTVAETERTPMTANSVAVNGNAIQGIVIGVLICGYEPGVLWRGHGGRCAAFAVVAPIIGSPSQQTSCTAIFKEGGSTKAAGESKSAIARVPSIGAKRRANVESHIATKSPGGSGRDERPRAPSTRPL